MVLDKDFGSMVAYRHPNIVSVPIKDVIAAPTRVETDDQLVKTARGIGISLGD
jgi:6-phosphofructokinase 1